MYENDLCGGGMTKEADITTCHREYTKYLPRWTRCKIVMEGADAVKAAGEALLPKLPGQNRESYDHYRERAVFFNATGKTLELYTSMVFSKAPTIKGIEGEKPPPRGRRPERQTFRGAAGGHTRRRDRLRTLWHPRGLLRDGTGRHEPR